MRWIEEAEARRMWLHDAESRPAYAESLAEAEPMAISKATLTVLVSKITGRIARAARIRPSAGEKDAPAEGCDCTRASWIAIGRGGAPSRIAGGSPAGASLPA
jgi:hypothetical protein